MEAIAAHHGYRLLAMGAIIGVNAFFAAAETALVSVRASRLRQMADEGQLGAQAALNLLARPERLLSVSQVGLTVASLVLGWLGESTLHDLLFAWFGFVSDPATRAAISVVCLVLGFVLMTFTHVVFGEVVPKNFAIEKADRLAVLVAPTLLICYRLVEPFVWVIEHSASVASRLIGVHGHQRGAHSPEELKFVVASSHLAGHLTEFEAEAMDRIVDLQDYSVRQVMVPRNQFVTVPADGAIDDVLRLASESRYSRLPVCQTGSENPIGYVHVKDVLEFWTQSRMGRRAAHRFDVRRLLRKAPVVPESRELHLVLDDLRQQHAHVAFVVNEYGTVSGLVTIEDVFEQIFGEIEDEFDAHVADYVEESDSFDVDGTIPIRDLEMQYDLHLPPSEDFETLAGFLLLHLGRIPVAGDQVHYAGHRFAVLAMDFNRVARVRVEKADAAASADGVDGLNGEK